MADALYSTDGRAQPVSAISPHAEPQAACMTKRYWYTSWDSHARPCATARPACCGPSCSQHAPHLGAEVQTRVCYSLELVTDGLRGKTRWWRKAPLELSHAERPLLGNERSVMLFAAGSAAKEQWFTVLRRAAGAALPCAPLQLPPAGIHPLQTGDLSVQMHSTVTWA